MFSIYWSTFIQFWANYFKVMAAITYYETLSVPLFLIKKAIPPGCEKFTAMDGNWKLRFPHCMFPVKAEVCGIENINYPSVCTEQPSNPRSAFCDRHCEEAKKKGIPTGLRDFVYNYCGVTREREGW